MMRRNVCDKEAPMGYALVNGHVLDGTLDEGGQMAVHDGWAVIVDGDRIAAVGSLSRRTSLVTRSSTLVAPT